MQPVDASQPLSNSRKAGYGVGVYGIFLAWMMTAITLMNFYTEVLGLSAQDAGAIFFIAAIWDAITDPVMGWINDRLKTRWGRYRPWLLFAAVPFAASFAAMFWKPAIGNTADLFLWALVVHLIFRTFYTAVYMPYTAMIARLSTNGKERASIAGVKNVFTAAAALTVSFLIFDAIEFFGDQGNGKIDDAQGFWMVALIIACVAVLALWSCFAFTREPPLERLEDENAAAQKTTLGDIKSLASNRAFWIVFFAVIAFTGCYTIINKAIVYYSQWNLGDRTLAKYSLTAIGLAGIISPLLWVQVSRMKGKSTTWISGCLLASLCLGVIFAIGDMSLWTRTALFFLAGCGIHAVLMTFYAALADAADFGEWQSGVRVEAPLFGLVSFANKVSLGIGAWALGFGLEAAGYQSGKDVINQTPEALAAIGFWMTIIPISGILLSALIIFFFPVSNSLHSQIERDLRDSSTQST
ncbi:glycoside/pentoside/hexuronide:cation symporter, GPH family [Parasphingorhabdus marina DSM 22363]|uniref:Glycoside/pentoside/hexuronide:cation symporter, GPH family n=1 Tax=Parasphingorhabdus marina DSM 22363 TaxID=1123272 RepID=A0A1N6D3Y2_9SPHN|nr:glycoside-pentoside-hexuronide (GPH):cation symporter [Parasphingorhabdus marina]SIN65528.1 glycoside/pentoside/hexuronide:cation symporter, GPH family [Parasphingorhabdus marina DSM 22363]